MDISMDTSSIREMQTSPMGRMLGATSGAGSNEEGAPMGGPVDTVELSNAGHMIMTGMNLADAGNTEVQDFMSKLEEDLQSGDFDLESALASAPEALTTALEGEGIDFEEALTTLSELPGGMPPPPPPPEGEEMGEGGPEGAGGPPGGGGPQGAGGPPGGGGETQAASEDTTASEIADIQSEIMEIQQEISKLQSQAKTEDVDTQISAKQSELASKQAELSLLASEETEA